MSFSVRNCVGTFAAEIRPWQKDQARDVPVNLAGMPKLNLWSMMWYPAMKVLGLLREFGVLTTYNSIFSSFK